MKYALIVSVAALSLLSCGEEPLKDYYKLDSLRVLDIHMDVPETNQLDTDVNFSLTPLLSDVGGTGSVNLKWDICLDPGVAYGKDPTCSDTSVSQQTHTFASSVRTEAGTPQIKTFKMPSSIFSSAGSAKQFNGVAVLVTLEASNSSTTVKSFRRVLFSSKTSNLNSNPSLSDFLVQGSAWATTPTTKSALTPVLGGGSQENYEFKTEDGNLVSLSEELQVTWFVSSGKLTRTRTVGEAATEWTPDSSSSGVVVLVLRDGRGGSASYIRQY